MPRRERSTIVGELLEALAVSHDEGATALTRVAIRVNLPYDRFTTYLKDLRSHGIVDSSNPRKLTHKGEELLRKYRAWTQALRLFGLLPKTVVAHDS